MFYDELRRFNEKCEAIMKESGVIQKSFFSLWFLLLDVVFFMSHMSKERVSGGLTFRSLWASRMQLRKDRTDFRHKLFSGTMGFEIKIMLVLLSRVSDERKRSKDYCFNSFSLGQS